MSSSVPRKRRSFDVTEHYSRSNGLPAQQTEMTDEERELAEHVISKMNDAEFAELVETIQRGYQEQSDSACLYCDKPGRTRDHPFHGKRKRT